MRHGDSTIFSRLLTILGVKHTSEYSDEQFDKMPFRTLFGLSTLLRSYGVDSMGVRVQDHSEIAQLTPPFIAPVKNRFVIVTSVCNGNVVYSTDGIAEQAPITDFISAWDGTAFLVSKTEKACEPGYLKHRFAEMMTWLRNVGMVVGAIALLAWAFIANGLYERVWMYPLVLFYICGIALSYLLVQKTLGVKNKAADHVCGVLEQGGCDRIAKSDGASFMGIFHWSEVGLTFFGISLMTLLLFPQSAGALCLINICALPYTVWSISYQRFVAHTWCTMCVGVQLLLWLCFACLSFDGALHSLFVSGWHIIALIIAYGTTMLTINRLDSFIINRKQTPENDTSQPI